MKYLKNIIICVLVLFVFSMGKTQYNSLQILNQPYLHELYESGQYNLLEEKCDSIIQYSEDPLEAAASNIYKSLIQSDQGYLYQSLNYISEAESLYDGAKHPKGIALSNLKKASVYLLIGDKINAKIALSEIDKHVTQSEINSSLFIEMYELQSLVLSSESMHQEAIEAKKKALQLYTKFQSSSKYKTNSLFDQIASDYYSLGKLDSAISYYDKLIDNYNLDSYESKLNTLSTISELCTQKGDYEEAIGHLVYGVQIADENADTIFLQNLNTQISSLFIKQKQWNKAIGYSDRALELLNLKPNSFLRANNYYFNGQSHFHKNDFHLAQHELLNALRLFSDLENYNRISDVLFSMAAFGMALPEIKGLREGVEEALKIHEKSEDELSQVKSKLVLAQLDRLENNILRAKKAVEEVLTLTETSGNMPAQETAHLMLSEINVELGNYQKAHQHAQSYHAIYDQLRSDDVNERINRLNIEFETEKTEQALETQKLITSNQEELLRRKNLQNVLLFIGLILAFIIAIGLYILRIKNKQLQKQKQITDSKEKETAILKAELKGESLERARVARELHDGLGTVLATVKMQMNGIQNTYPQVIKVEAYQKAEALIDNACQSVRDISHDMMPTIIQDQGLDQAIETLCNTINSREELHINYIPYQVDLVNDKELEFNVYRIIQELLKNILNHAEAKEVIVQITNEDGFLTLTVEDDGNGFNIEEKKEGIGFENIKFRVQNLNGNLEIDSTLKKGSTIHISLPLS